MNIPEYVFLPLKIRCIILIAIGRARRLGLPVDPVNLSLWEDAFQDAVAALLQKTNGPSDLNEHSWPPYLAVTTVNCFRNIIRRRDNRVEQLTQESDDDQGRAVHPVPSVSWNAEDALTTIARRELVFDSMTEFAHTLGERHGLLRQTMFTILFWSKIEPESLNCDLLMNTIRSYYPDAPSRSAVYRDFSAFVNRVRQSAAGVADGEGDTLD